MDYHHETTALTFQFINKSAFYLTSLFYFIGFPPIIIFVGGSVTLLKRTDDDDAHSSYATVAYWSIKGADDDNSAILDLAFNADNTSIITASSSVKRWSLSGLKLYKQNKSTL